MKHSLAIVRSDVSGPPLTGVSRAVRAQNAENASKMSPGASGPRTPKSLENVLGIFRNTLPTLSGDSLSRTVPETFSLALKAGQDKAGRSDLPHLAMQTAPGKNTENADCLSSPQKRGV